MITCGKRGRGQDGPRHTGYSRKPGFTETRLRPLARRRERTFWPPWVFMRERNPCFFDRLRRLGWNVRLGIEKYLLLIRSAVLGQTKSINQPSHYRQTRERRMWRREKRLHPPNRPILTLTLARARAPMRRARLCVRAREGEYL